MRLKSCLAAAFIFAGLSAVAAETTPSPLTPSALNDLGPRWWRWRIALPAIALPDKDAAGHFCDVGQSDKTWFLAGILTFSEASTPTLRRCVVPAGRRLFFPVVTLFRITHGEVTCERAQTQVSSGIDRSEHLSATLDGVDLLAAGRTRWKSSSCFRLNLPADGPSADLAAAADGYWVLLDPLSKGHHMLVFGGLLSSDQSDPTRLQATSYDLEVR